MNTIIIIIAISAIVTAAFFIGMWVGVCAAIDNTIDDNDEGRAYCFECEMEMPVTEKIGNLFCSNCGLCH